MNSKMTDILQVLDQVDFTLLIYSDAIDKVRASLTTLSSTIDVSLNQFGIVVTNDVDTAAEYIEENITNDKKEFIRVITYEDYANLMQFGGSVIVFDSAFELYDLFRSPNSNENLSDTIEEFFGNMMRRNNKIMAIFDEDITAISTENDKESTRYYLTRTMIYNDYAEIIGSPPLLLTCDFDNNVCNKYKMYKFRSYMSDDQKAKVLSLNPPLNFGALDEWKFVVEGFLDNADQATVPKIIGYSNIVYPFNIQTLIDNNQLDQIPPVESLVRVVGYKDLLKNAPKISQLLDFVNQHIEQRHIIYTAYPGINGAELLKALFDNLDEGKQVKTNCINIDPLLSDQDKYNLLQEWNVSDGNNYQHRVLIIGSPLLARPRQTDHYHILDFNLGEAFEQIDAIFKNDNYVNSNTDLTVHLHYSTYKDSTGDALSLNADVVDQLCEEVAKSWKSKQYYAANGYKVADSNGRFYIYAPGTKFIR